MSSRHARLGSRLVAFDGLAIQRSGAWSACLAHPPHVDVTQGTRSSLRLGWGGRLLLSALLGASSVSLAAEPLAAEPAGLEASTGDGSSSTSRAPSWSLGRLVQAALDQSPEMVGKRLELDAAVAKQREARAARLPKANFQIQATKMTPFIEGIVLRPGSYGSISLPDTSGFTADGYIPPANIELFEGMPEQQLSTFVQVEQPVFTSGKLSLAVRLADLNHELEERRLLEKGFETAYLVQKLGLGLYLGEASLVLLETMTRELGQILADTKQIQARGLVTEADVLGVEAQLRGLEEEQAKGRAELVRMRETLRIFTGASEGDALTLEGSLETLPQAVAVPLEGLLDEALKARPELKSLETQVDLARANVRFSTTDLPFRPVVGLRVEGGFRGERVPGLQTNWTKTWDHYYQASLALQLKLMDGGAAAAKVRQNRLQAERAELGQTQQRAFILAQVKEQHARLEASRLGLVRAEAEEKAARERRRQSELGSQRGTVGRSEFLKSHLDWSKARSSRLLALFNLQVGQLELDHASGRLPKRAVEATQLPSGPQPERQGAP